MSDQLEHDPRPCIVCTRTLDDTEPQTCYRCYQHARTLLADVVTLYAELPDVIGHLAAIKTSSMPAEKYPSPAMPGGDALVLLSGGSDGAFWRAASEQPQTAWVCVACDVRVRHRATHMLDVHDTEAWSAPGLFVPTDPEYRGQDVHFPQDAPSAAAVLGQWEDAWRVQRAEPAAPHAASVRTAVAYLRGTLQWAANTSVAFDEFMADLRNLTARMKIVTGQIAPPVKSDARCFADNCEGRLEQRWRDDGLDEDRDCPDCGAHYTFSQYLLALKAHLEQQNAVIDAPMAAHIFGIDTNTLNVWEHRKKITHVERDEKGRKRYRYRDIADLVRDPRHARAS